MNPRQLLVCIMLLTASLSVIALIPGTVSAAPPEISDVHFTPKYPQMGEMINITARVIDPIGVTSVQLLYCSIPGGICTPYDMDGPNMAQIYNKSVPLYTGSIGADFYIAAMNTNSEVNNSETYYIQYALNITAIMNADRTEAYPGQSFNLTVNAYYSDNTSAPCEYCDVDIVLIGTTQHWTGNMDDMGNFTVELNAPGTVGNYIYNVTVSNRTLTTYAEALLLVLTEPLPDLVVTTAGITYSPSSPYVGDNVTANITVRNLGTLNATFRVLITLDGTTVLKNVSVTLSQGNSTVVTVSWIALQGSQTLSVVLDPGNLVREVSDSNNQASVTVVGQEIPVDDTPQDYTMYIIIAVIVIIIVLLLILLAARRKKPEQPMQ